VVRDHGDVLRKHGFVVRDHGDVLRKHGPVVHDLDHKLADHANIVSKNADFAADLERVALDLEDDHLRHVHMAQDRTNTDLDLHPAAPELAAEAPTFLSAPRAYASASPAH
jgi:hypothetical protein